MALAATFLTSSPASAAGELARAREARDAFLQNVSGKKRGEWTALVKQFEEAAKVQPQAQWGAVARLEGAQLAFRSYERFKIEADAVTAARLARASVKGCPRCPEAPAAQVLLGRALIAQKKPEEAYRELMKVGLSYQGSIEHSEAEDLMAELSGGKKRPSAQRASGSPQVATPASGQASSGASSQAKPAASQGGAGASNQARPASSKSTPPKAVPAPQRPLPKAPRPREDGRNQFYSYRLDDMGDYSEVTAYLDRVVPYLYNLLPPSSDGGRFRVYVDFKDTVLAPGTASSLKTQTSLVKLVKVNQLTADTVRLVADLPGAFPYAPVFVENPPRLIIRVAKEADKLPAMESDAPPAPRPPASVKPRPAKGPANSMARQLGLSVKKVVIDPGHGGKDGGAAAGGIKEKDIVLSVALSLKSKIETMLGLEVILTRTTDKFVTLDRRTKIANDQKADLFISLHVNANDLPKVEGLETYILNFTDDPEAMKVAARENSGSGKPMAELRDLVLKIATNTRVAESRVLAKAVHAGAMASIRKSRKTRDLGVKEAAFLVLANVEVPAILIEMGFITNAAEAKLLTTSAYQDRITDGIVDGLKAYLEGLP
jgi:N-acetylmuramoyl-L-alanine amidase